MPPAVPAEVFEAAFPFGFVVDESLTLVRLSPGLRRLCPQAQVGMPLTGPATLEMPPIPMTFESLSDHPESSWSSR